jgi:hypothetical protein
LACRPITAAVIGTAITAAGRMADGLPCSRRQLKIDRMRTESDRDSNREPALAARVRDVIGSPLGFLLDGPDLSTLVLSELWKRPVAPGARALKPYCAVMAMATDALRGARALLLVHDLGGVFLQLRRADEMHTLAVSFGLDPGEAERWLGGGQVKQVDLRRRIEKEDPRLAGAMRTVHAMLSDEAHGRTQALAVYENVDGEFDWPPHADKVDPVRIRSAFMAAMALLLSHFGVLRWLLRDWGNLSPTVGPEVAGYYAALVEFVLDREAHGNWTAIAPGHAAAWLGIE